MSNKKNSLITEIPSNLSSLLIKLDEVKKDPALKPNHRGARKILVTELYPNKEKIALESLWHAPENETSLTSVLLGNKTEIAVFNQYAKQDKHYHKLATEVYLLLEGTMVIEVEGQDYILSAKDTIVINPMAVHLVKPNKEDFLCMVLSSNCIGTSDKYLV